MTTSFHPSAPGMVEAQLLAHEASTWARSASEALRVACRLTAADSVRLRQESCALRAAAAALRAR